MIYNELFLDATNRILAFYGGRGRLSLLRKVAAQLAATGKTVLVLSHGSQKLPVSGEVLLCKSPHLMVSQLVETFAKSTIIYCGKTTSGQLVEGFTLPEINSIAHIAPADYVLIDVGKSRHCQKLSREYLQDLTAAAKWDQLIYYLDIEDFFDTGNESRPEKMSSKPLYHSDAVLSLKKYFAGFGVEALLNRDWPVLLLFGGVTSTIEENVVLQLSRDLWQSGYVHFAFSGHHQAEYRPLKMS